MGGGGRRINPQLGLISDIIILHHKILIMSPWAYFGSKGLFAKFILGGGGRGGLHVYMNKYFLFKQL